MISKSLDKKLQLGLELVALAFLAWVTYRVWDTNPLGVAIVTAAGILAGFLITRFAPKKPVLNLVLVVAAFAVFLYLMTPGATDKFGSLGLSWLISIPVGIFVGTKVLQHKAKSAKSVTSRR